MVVIEDVTTSGKSIEETFPILKAQGNVEIKGLIVSLNRMERRKGRESALWKKSRIYMVSQLLPSSICRKCTEYLYNRECGGKVVIDDTIKAAIDAYYEQYGAK